MLGLPGDLVARGQLVGHAENIVPFYLQQYLMKALYFMLKQILAISIGFVQNKQIAIVIFHCFGFLISNHTLVARATATAAFSTARVYISLATCYSYRSQ
jgi:hypothetical protein